MPFTVAAVATVTEPAHVIRSVGYNCGTPQEFSANTPYTFLSQNGTIGAIISGMGWLKKQFPETKTVSVFIPMTVLSSISNRKCGNGHKKTGWK